MRQGVTKVQESPQQGAQAMPHTCTIGGAASCTQSGEIAQKSGKNMWKKALIQFSFDWIAVQPFGF